MCEGGRCLSNHQADIFLTTLKPQQRVVTAHDVASSLYYFHVDSVHDEEIRELLDIEQGLQRDGEKGKENARPRSGGQSPKRRPLPSAPRLALKDCSESPPNFYPHFETPVGQDGRSRLVRKPVGGNNPDICLKANRTSKVIPRKLWGPRPLHSRNLSVDGAMTSNISKEEILVPRRFSEQPPGVLPKPNLDVNSEDDTVEQNTNFSITIIRRDPSSGGQWNVGKIASGPTAAKQSDEPNSARNPHPGREQILCLEITNAGYNKYQPVEVFLKPEKASVDYTSTPQGAETHSLAISNNDEYHSFRRNLFLGRPRSQSNGPLPRGSEFQSSTDHVRSAEESSLTSPYNSPQSSTSPPGSYSFLSPWNGICEFSTGLAGRSLKCRHTLHSPASSPGNKDSSSARTVSDLRFNLPSSKMLGLLSPRRLPLPTASYKRSSFFGNSHSRDADASNHDEAENSDDGDEERMDLSLGQEQAGGGLRGKQAKLGKLVIEDEGLKMLDLVVAANMGLWWSVCGNGLG